MGPTNRKLASCAFNANASNVLTSSQDSLHQLPSNTEMNDYPRLLRGFYEYLHVGCTNA
jgi:hypothetical protein